MSDQALVPAAPPPPVRIATSLAEAGPNELLLVDADGQVLSPAEARRIGRRRIWIQRGLTWGLGGGLALVTIWNPVFWVLIVGVGGWGVWASKTLARVSLAQRLMYADRLEEAEEELRLATRPRLVSKTLRGLAWMLFADVARYRGDHGIALMRVRQAKRLLPVEHPWQPYCSYIEIAVLSDLDQLDEAERLFAQRHRVVPKGDYMRMLHWGVELYLALGRSKHRLDAQELDARAAAVLPLRTSQALLALVAWAYHASGDVARGRELLRIALEREERFPLATTMPRLQEWIDATRDPRAALPP